MMVERGVGEHQIKRAQQAESVLLKNIPQQSWIRYKDIVEKTKLSTATVSKYLKTLEKSGYIEKKVDIKSGEYPYPAIYKKTVSGTEEEFKMKLARIITRLDLKATIKIPERALSPFSPKKIIEGESYSPLSESKVARECREFLERKVLASLKRKRPGKSEKFLIKVSKMVADLFLILVQESIGVGVLTALKISKVGTSEYEYGLLSSKAKIDVYAKIWQNLFDAFLLLLKDSIKQYDSLDGFLSEMTKNDEIIIFVGGLFPSLADKMIGVIETAGTG